MSETFNTVTTVKELKALPNGSVISPDYYEGRAVALRVSDDSWAVAGQNFPFSSELLFAGFRGEPATVLHLPGEVTE